MKHSIITHSSFAVLNTFLKFSRKEKTDINAQKGVKLVYIAHGYSLAINDKPLINEDIQVWPMGFMVPSIHSKSKELRFKNKEIKSFFNTWDADLEEYYAEFINAHQNPDDFTIIEKVWEFFKNHSSVNIADWTLNNGPDIKKLLIQARNSGVIYTKVDNEVLKEGFKKLLK